MRWTEWLLLGLALWTAVGVAGTLLLTLQRQHQRAARGAWWIAGVWAVYLLVLTTISRSQGARTIPRGAEQCFDEMCFAVTGADELQGFQARGVERERLLRVSIQINHRGSGSPKADAGIRAFVIDAAGRRWPEVRGLSGVRLTVSVPAGSRVVSQPVFRVGKDATGLGLVLTHGRWQPGVLIWGDPDSWMHWPTILELRGRD